MQVIAKLPIQDAFCVRIPPHSDSRGCFEIFWEMSNLSNSDFDFCPTNAYHSYNPTLHTLRGLHYQEAPHMQAKLVSCVAGQAMDVIVDLRPESHTFRSWYSQELIESSGVSLYIPYGCAHGFITLKPNTTIAYLIDGEYKAEAGKIIRWNDPTFDIKWPVDYPLLSERDANAKDWAPK